MKRCVLFVLVGLALLCSVLGADEPKKSATPPQLLNYQGRLVDENGVPVPDGVYTVYFRIYDVPTEGQPVWEEQQDVTVFKGLYSVLLHVSDEIDWTTDKWFAVRVSGQSEMVPRQQMASVPWAFRAAKATEADTASVAGIAQDVADGAVTTPKLADGGVASEKIADGAVTSAKLARTHTFTELGVVVPLDPPETWRDILTVTISPDQPMLVTVSGMVAITNPSGFVGTQARITVDGTVIAWLVGHTHPGVTDGRCLVGVRSVAAGQHTVTLQALQNGEGCVVEPYGQTQLSVLEG